VPLAPSNHQVEGPLAPAKKEEARTQFFAESFVLNALV
jgi:hypothetical protein